VTEAPRALVLVELGGVPADVVAAALGLMAFEAQQRARRGGWQLHRISAVEAAEIEAQRLRAEGLNAFALPLSEVSPADDPLVAVGGRALANGLRLRTDRESFDVHPEEILLLVVGTIHREVTDEVKKRHSRPPRPQPGLRFHLNRRDAAQPIKLDPDSIAFDDTPVVPSSSLIEIRSWIAALAPPPALDEGFRDVTPALSPSRRADAGLSTALRSGPAREDAATPLDNLPQFRFYSGWRAALARRTGRR
jgi:hypothetical protein